MGHSTPRADEPLIVLAVITRPQGVRGELRLKRFNVESSLLFEQTQVIVRQGAEQHVRRVLAIRPHGELAVARLEGVESREAADTLRGAEVCVPRSALPPLEEGEYYHADLVGLMAETPDGQALGPILDVLVYPSADALRLQCADGIREVPMLEPYLVEVDVPAGRVVLNHVTDIPLEKGVASEPSAPPEDRDKADS